MNWTKIAMAMIVVFGVICITGLAIFLATVWKALEVMK